MVPRTLRVSILVATCLGCLLPTACDKASTPTGPKTQVNYHKPNANEQIVTQTEFGEAEKRSSIYQLEPDRGGGYFFRGLYNGKGGLGRLDGTGSLSWFRSVSHTLRDIQPMAGLGARPSGAVTVGKEDNDGDGWSDVGYVSFYNSSGRLLSLAVYASDSSNVMLDAVAPVSDSLLLVVGGERSAGRTHPFVATVALTADGQIQKRGSRVMSEVSDRYATDVAVGPAPTGTSPADLYVSTASGGAGDAVTLHRLDATLPDLASPVLAWTRTVSVGAVKSWGNDLRVADGRLYVAGGGYDSSKDPRPASGGYWDSGLAACLSLSGDVIWQRLIAITRQNEGLGAIVPTPAATYVVGRGAAYEHDAQTFGYGWILKLDPATGGTQATWTFGDERYSSGFNFAWMSGTRIHAGGWCRHAVEGGPFRAWFCDILPAGPGQTSSDWVTERARAARGAGAAAPSVDRGR